MSRRIRTLKITILAVVALTAFASVAQANAPTSSDGDSKPPAGCEADSSCKPTTPPTPPVTTTTTVTESTPVTETTPDVPATETTPDVPTVETPDVPVALPAKPVVDTPAVADVPAATPGAGTELPFTGPGDVILAIVIALLAGTGGALLLLGAGSREVIEGLSKRTMASPSAFRVAYREHLKRQLEE
jgi:hypothetical protein